MVAFWGRLRRVTAGWAGLSLMVLPSLVFQTWRGPGHHTTTLHPILSIPIYLKQKAARENGPGPLQRKAEHSVISQVWEESSAAVTSSSSFFSLGPATCSGERSSEAENGALVTLNSVLSVSLGPEKQATCPWC